MSLADRVRLSPIRSAGTSPALARGNRERQPVLGRRQRARPAIVVRARRVVRVVEVEQDFARAHAQVGALDRVVEIAAAAIGAGAAGRVGKRQPQSAAVAFEPIDGERRRVSHGKAHLAGARAAQDAVGRQRNLERLPGRGLDDPSAATPAYTDQYDLASRAAIRRDRALRMLAEQPVARGAEACRLRRRRASPRARRRTPRPRGAANPRG